MREKARSILVVVVLFVQEFVRIAYVAASERACTLAFRASREPTSPCKTIESVSGLWTRRSYLSEGIFDMYRLYFVLLFALLAMPPSLSGCGGDALAPPDGQPSAVGDVSSEFSDASVKPYDPSDI